MIGGPDLLQVVPSCSLHCEALDHITRELSNGVSYLVVCSVDLENIKIFTCWITQWMAVGSAITCHMWNSRSQRIPARTLIILSVFMANAEIVPSVRPQLLPLASPQIHYPLFQSYHSTLCSLDY
jgi:hypothetical protein